MYFFLQLRQLFLPVPTWQCLENAISKLRLAWDRRTTHSLPSRSILCGIGHTLPLLWGVLLKPHRLNCIQPNEIADCCFNVLATIKVISGWVLTFCSVRLWRLYSASSLISHLATLSGLWANQSLPYPNNAEGLAKRWQVSILKSLVWLDQNSKWEIGALLIQPASLISRKEIVT